jgi:hypothetical protein
LVAVASSPTFGWFYKGRSRARGIGAARCGAIKQVVVAICGQGLDRDQSWSAIETQKHHEGCASTPKPS